MGFGWVLILACSREQLAVSLQASGSADPGINHRIQSRFRGKGEVEVLVWVGLPISDFSHAPVS